MPVVTIVDLPTIPSISDSDVLPVVGVSANTTYKVTKQSLLAGVFPYTGSVGISGSLSIVGPTTLNVLPATSATILAMQAGGNARYFFSVGASGEAQIRTGNNVNLTLGVNQDAITIKDGGSVGFGISNPQYTIDISGSAAMRLGGDITDASDVSLRVGGNSTYRYLNLLNGGGASGLRAGGLLVSDTYAYANPSAGNVVIQKSLAVGLTTPSATTGRIDAANDVVAFSTSDANYKNNVTKIEGALEKVKQINGVEFDWIENAEVHGNSGHDVGVIAQEIEKVLPEVVTTRENGVKAVKYEKIVSLLIEAIKDLEKQVEELKKK